MALRYRDRVYNKLQMAEPIAHWRDLEDCKKLLTLGTAADLTLAAAERATGRQIQVLHAHQLAEKEWISEPFERNPTSVCMRHDMKKGVDVIVAPLLHLGHFTLLALHVDSKGNPLALCFFDSRGSNYRDWTPDWQHKRFLKFCAAITGTNFATLQATDVLNCRISYQTDGSSCAIFCVVTTMLIGRRIETQCVLLNDEVVKFRKKLYRWCQANCRPAFPKPVVYPRIDNSTEQYYPEAIQFFGTFSYCCCNNVFQKRQPA